MASKPAPDTTPTPKTTRAPRRSVNPAEKAQAALDVAIRKLKALGSKEEELAVQMGQVADARRAAQAQVDYLATNPLLAPEPEDTPEDMIEALALAREGDAER